MGGVFVKILYEETVHSFGLVNRNDAQRTKIPSTSVNYKNGIWNSNSRIHYESKNAPGVECAASTGTGPCIKNPAVLSREIKHRSILTNSNNGAPEIKLNPNTNERDVPPIMKLVIHQSCSAKAKEKQLAALSEVTHEMPKVCEKVLQAPAAPLRRRQLTKKALDNCKLCSRSKSRRRSFSRTTTKPMVTFKSDGSTVEIKMPTGKARSSKIAMPTTIMIGKLSPRPHVEPNAPPFLSFEYQYSSVTDKDSMGFSAPLSSLIKDLDSDFDCNDLSSTELAQKTFFFTHLNTLVNSSYGEIEWNGITIVLTDGIKSRLKLWNFETEPTKLVLDLAGCTEMHVFKAKTKMEIKGQDINGTEKWFRMTGEDVDLIQISNVQNGKFSLTLPEI